MSVKFLEQLKNYSVSGTNNRFQASDSEFSPIFDPHITPNYASYPSFVENQSGISPTFAVDAIEYAENIPILGWFFEHIPRPVVIK